MSAASASAAPVDLARTFRAMASTVELHVVDAVAGAERALDRAEAAVRVVEEHCSRFDPTSALSRANLEPDVWHLVPGVLADAVAEAARAHRATAGLFDPRVLEVLVRWGYDRSLPFADGPVQRPGEPELPRPAEPPAVSPADGWQGSRGPWRPCIEPGTGDRRVHLGGSGVDLGGIGKGIAVRLAAAELAAAGGSYLVDAGGDLALGGPGPDGTGWRVGVEDPAGGVEPLLVLELADTACATSSTRLRRWRAGGAEVHHLVDPRSARPGGDGLASVTVVAPDPAWAEVWSKTLFLAGPGDVRTRAEDLGLAAAWVGDDGTIGVSSAMVGAVLWRRSDA